MPSEVQKVKHQKSSGPL